MHFIFAFVADPVVLANGVRDTILRIAGAGAMILLVLALIRGGIGGVRGKVELVMALFDVWLLYDPQSVLDYIGRFGR